MKILKRIKAILFGTTPVEESTPEQLREASRVHRRLTRFPRLRHCPNIAARRNAVFKHRYGIA